MYYWQSHLHPHLFHSKRSDYIQLENLVVLWFNFSTCQSIDCNCNIGIFGNYKCKIPSIFHWIRIGKAICSIDTTPELLHTKISFFNCWVIKIVKHNKLNCVASFREIIKLPGKFSYSSRTSNIHKSICHIDRR